jgi:hypothetical protein
VSQFPHSGSKQYSISNKSELNLQKRSYTTHLGSLEADLTAYGERESKASFNASLVFKGLGVSTAGLFYATWEREGLSEAQMNELRSRGIKHAVAGNVDVMRETLKTKGIK